MTRRNLIVLLIILSFWIVLFYFFDPLEFLNSYSIPEEDNEIMLCCYKADLGLKNRRYYIITTSGEVKKYMPDHPVLLDELKDWNLKAESIISVEITEDIVQKIKMINTEKYRSWKLNTRYEIAMPEVTYCLVQDTGEGFELKTIKKQIYNGNFESDFQTVKKCKSFYVNDICDFIDEIIEKTENVLLLSSGV